jgi:hypothetical protein
LKLWFPLRLVQKGLDPAVRTSIAYAFFSFLVDASINLFEMKKRKIDDDGDDDEAEKR